MHVFTVDYFLHLLAEQGVEVEEILLPRHDGSVVPTITLVRNSGSDQYMVPLGPLRREDLVTPQVVDSWCDQLQIPRVGYGVVESG